MLPSAGTQLEELELPEEPVLEQLNAVTMAKRMAHMVSFDTVMFRIGVWTIPDRILSLAAGTSLGRIRRAAAQEQGEESGAERRWRQDSER